MWLKKGFVFVKAGCDFSSPDAVVNLGVGKNMVASIRFWMRAFGMSQDDKLTELAEYLNIFHANGTGLPAHIAWTGQ